MRRPYSAPRLLESRVILPHHVAQLEASAIDFLTSAFAGVSSVTHGQAHDMGIRGDGDLGGLCFRYWQPLEQQFSGRFIRIKPDSAVSARKYLQPVGEKPAFYFPAGTTRKELQNAFLPILIVEGEKKALALHRALLQIDHPGLVIGLGGCWAWRRSACELQTDGKLGKGQSRAVEHFDWVTWGGRRVFLVPDSDVLTNWKVAAAETALARELRSRGARVSIVRLEERGAWRRLGSTI